MKLEQIALVVVVAYGILWVGGAMTGLILAVPYGFLGLIPVAIFVGLLVAVIVQRLNNREDDYYDKNVDQ